MGTARALEMKALLVNYHRGAGSCPDPSGKLNSGNRGVGRTCLGLSSPHFPLHHWKKEKEKHSKRKRKKKHSFPLHIPLPSNCECLT